MMHGEKFKLVQHMNIKQTSLKHLSLVKPMHEHPQTDIVHMETRVFNVHTEGNALQCHAVQKYQHFIYITDYSYVVLTFTVWPILRSYYTRTKSLWLENVFSFSSWYKFKHKIQMSSSGFPLLYCRCKCSVQCFRYWQKNMFYQTLRSSWTATLMKRCRELFKKSSWHWD